MDAQLERRERFASDYLLERDALYVAPLGDACRFVNVDRLFARRETNVIVVSGVAGVGKSTYASEFARHYIALNAFEHDHCTMHFCASTLERMRDQLFAKLIDLLFPSAAAAAEKRERRALLKRAQSLRRVDLEYVVARLNARMINTRYSFLLVCDDLGTNSADDAPLGQEEEGQNTNELVRSTLDLLALLVRNLQANVRLVVTSRLSRRAFAERAPRLASTVHFVELALLERVDAAAFLAKRLKSHNDDDHHRLDVEYILDRLWNVTAAAAAAAADVDEQQEQKQQLFLPYRLQLVASYINANRGRVRSVRHAIDELTSPPTHDNSSSSSLSTTSNDPITQRVAKRLFAQFFDNDDDDITKVVLQLVAYVMLPSSHAAISHQTLAAMFGLDECAVAGALGRLEALSLLRVQCSQQHGCRYTMERAIHGELRAYVRGRFASSSSTFLTEMLRRASRYLLRQTPTHSDDVNLKARRDLVRQAASVFNAAASTNLNSSSSSSSVIASVAQAGRTIADKCAAVFLFEEEMRVGEQLVRLYENESGEDRLDAALTRQKLGVASANLGRYHAALGQFNRSLIALSTIYANDRHPEVARVLRSMCNALQKMKRDELALDYFDRALNAMLDIYQSCDGGRHEDVAHVLVNMGGSYFQLGRFEACIQYSMRAVGIYQHLQRQTEPVEQHDNHDTDGDDDNGDDSDDAQR